METRITRLSACLLVATMLSVSAAHAATFTAVPTYDEQTTNLYTITGEASNNNITAAAFGTLVNNAFTAGTGGVLNFDNDTLDSDTAFDVTFDGGSQALSISSTELGITTAQTHSTVNNGISNVAGLSGGRHVGAGGSFTWTFGTSLTAFGLTAVSRDNDPTVSMTVNLEDGSSVNLGTEIITATNTNGGLAFDPGTGENWDPTNIFFGYQASASNPIVSVDVSQSTFTRYDDLGFVVVPEPGTAALVFAAAGLITLRRRHRMHR